MKISTELINEGKFKVIISSKLLEDYYMNLKNMVAKDKTCPPGFNIERLNKNTAVMTFDITKGAEMVRTSENTMSISSEGAGTLKDVLLITRRFLVQATKRQNQGLEFFPLKGYPDEDLQKDIVSAVESKRHMVLIDTYDSWEKYLKGPGQEFKQYLVRYGTDEYANLALKFHKGEIGDIRKEYTPKLEMFSWI